MILALTPSPQRQKPSGFKEVNGLSPSNQKKSSSPDSKKGAEQIPKPDYRTDSLMDSINALARRLEHLESTTTQLAEKANGKSWYNNDLLAPASLLATLLLAVVLGWVYSNLIAKIKRRKNDIKILPEKQQIVDIERKQPVQDNTDLKDRINELEKIVAEMQQNMKLLMTAPLPVDAPPPSAYSEPVSTSPVYLYVDINGGANPFQAGPKGKYTVLRLKDIGGGQYSFGIDPELSPGSVDEVLTKPKQLETFADLIIGIKPQRLETRAPGLARRLPNGTFEVIKKAQIEFLS